MMFTSSGSNAGDDGNEACLAVVSFRRLWESGLHQHENRVAGSKQRQSHGESVEKDITRTTFQVHWQVIVCLKDFLLLKDAVLDAVSTGCGKCTK